MTEPRKPIIADSEQGNTDASQSPDEGNPLSRLPIYLFHGDKRIIQPLNVPARNEVAHKSPALVKHVVAKALQHQANKEGLYEDTDCVIHWKPSAIPFLVKFEISVSKDTCQHLVSVRTINTKDLVSARLYALLAILTETAPIRKESCSTCKGFLRQAISKSTE